MTIVVFFPFDVRRLSLSTETEAFLWAFHFHTPFRGNVNIYKQRASTLEEASLMPVATQANSLWSTQASRKEISIRFRGHRPEIEIAEHRCLVKSVPHGPSATQPELLTPRKSITAPPTLSMRSCHSTPHKLSSPPSCLPMKSCRFTLCESTPSKSNPPNKPSPYIDSLLQTKKTVQIKTKERHWEPWMITSKLKLRPSLNILQDARYLAFEFVQKRTEARDKGDDRHRGGGRCGRSSTGKSGRVCKYLKKP